jgi:putative phosphoribosyl transferase
MVFRDRAEAGRLLAGRLESYREDPSGLILALPRGCVAVGYELSLTLHLPLDVFITRKLSTPENPEFAIGALSETGAVYLNSEAVEAFHLSHSELEGFIRNEQREITRRLQLYRNGLSHPTLSDRTVLLVDDGVATGATFFATVEAITVLSPRRVVAANPVAPHYCVIRLRGLVHELIVLATPEPFLAVGHHYRNFPQVGDTEVLAYLKNAKEARNTHSSPA